MAAASATASRAAAKQVFVCLVLVQRETNGNISILTRCQTSDLSLFTFTNMSSEMSNTVVSVRQSFATVNNNRQAIYHVNGTGTRTRRTGPIRTHLAMCWSIAIEGRIDRRRSYRPRPCLCIIAAHRDAVRFEIERARETTLGEATTTQASSALDSKGAQETRLSSVAVSSLFAPLFLLCGCRTVCPQAKVHQSECSAAVWLPPFLHCSANLPLSLTSLTD